MAFTWTGDPPAAKSLAYRTEDEGGDAGVLYAFYLFRDRAGLEQQLEATGLSDERLEARFEGHVISVPDSEGLGRDYYQPLSTLAAMIRSNPAQRIKSDLGDDKATYVDPFDVADSLEAEQLRLNARLIPNWGAGALEPGDAGGRFVSVVWGPGGS